MSQQPQTFDEALAPALAAYSAETAKHRKDWDNGGETCTCGYDPRPTLSPARSVGLHIAAMEKRASKAYDVAAAKISKAWGEQTFGGTRYGD